MIKLDNSFLDKIGLGSMPEDQKITFLQHMTAELQDRVGEKLADGLSDEQLSEFEKIIDGDKNSIRHWITKHSPKYLEDKLFQKMHTDSGLAGNDPRLIAEYTATKWLELNRPDYKEIVESTMEDLTQEIVDNKEAFLA